MTNLDGITLTVGLPVYNASTKVKIAIDSVLNQSWFGSMELLIVDDGSIDDTVEIIKGYKDNRIRLVQHDSNKGRAYARNTVLSEAKGKFLTWIDADDEWLPDKLRVQFDELLKHDDLSNLICICPYNLKWEHAGKFRLRSHDLSGDALRDILSGKVPAYLWTMLSLKDIYDRAGLFDLRLNRLQDLDMLIRITKNGARFVRTDKTKPLCNYYKTDSDKTGGEVFNAVDTIWQKHKILYELYGVKFLKKTRTNLFELSARHSMQNEGVIKASVFYIRSMLNAPKMTFNKTKNFFESK